MGPLLNISLQVCLDVWNEMWFLMTLVNAIIQVRIRGISLTILGRERWQRQWGMAEPKSNSSETTWWFLLGHFITSQVTSQEHPFGNTFDCLHETQQGNKCPQLLLPAGSVNEIEHGRRGFLALLFSLDWLTLINPGKWFHMIPVKLDLTACCLLFRPAQELSLWHLPPQKVIKSNSTGRFSTSLAWTVFCANED